MAAPDPISTGSDSAGLRGHIPALDGIRGIAVLVVIIHNAAYILHPDQSLILRLISAVTATGWAGVQLFFVLSGYLITGILLDSRGRDDYFRGFYIRRTLRIFPVYYIFLVLALLIVPLLVTLPEWEAKVSENQVWYWTYLSNWTSAFGRTIPGLAHFWSLAVEEQFYLLWPLAVWLLSNRGVLRATGAMILLAPLCRYLMHAWGLPQTALYEFTIARVDALGAGAALAVILRDPVHRALLERWWRRLALAAGAALVVFAAANHGFHSDEFPVQLYGQSLLILACAALLLAGLNPGASRPSALQRWLSHRSLRLLGKYSYTMYVIHFALLTVAAHYLLDTINDGSTAARVLKLTAYLAFILGASLLVAMGSWWLIESRFLALKDRWAPRPAATP